jgi:hypothetical protein
MLAKHKSILRGAYRSTCPPLIGDAGGLRKKVLKKSLYFYIALQTQISIGTESLTDLLINVFKQ